eukprot:scaffold305_cov110-Cylindrotheca_fusiformis.AAC.6
MSQFVEFLPKDLLGNLPNHTISHNTTILAGGGAAATILQRTRGSRHLFKTRPAKPRCSGGHDV